MSDGQADGPVDEVTLRSQAGTAGAERTYTCVPPGSGRRIGIDRDDDTVGDADEVDAGSNPTDPASLPAGLRTVLVQTSKMMLKDRSTRRIPRSAARHCSCTTRPAAERP